MSVLNTTNPAYLGRFVITFLAMILSVGIGELGNRAIMIMLYGIGLPHYALHIVYSKRGLTKAWETGRGKWILLSFLPLSVMVVLNGDFIVPALVLYFGLHHAMGEVYFKNNGESSGIRIAHWVSVIGSYFAMTGQYLPPFSELLIKLGLATMVIGTIMFIVQNRKHHNYSIRQVASYFPWIFLGPIFAMWAYGNHLDWRLIVIAHFILWFFLPYANKGLLKGPRLNTYWIQTILLTGLFTMITLGILFAPRHFDFDPGFLSEILLYNIFLIWSFLHQSWTFIVSGANPPWLRRIMGT